MSRTGSEVYTIPVLRLRWAYNKSYATTACQAQVLSYNAYVKYATRVPQTLPHPATLPNTAPTQHTRRHRLERLGPVQAAPMVQAEPNGTTGYPCLVRVVAELLPK